MRCTARKSLIKEKRKEEVERGKMTYAGTTQIGVTQHKQNLPAHTLPAYSITRE